MKSIVIVTDAWRPQVNGVVRTLEYTIDVLQNHGMRVEIICPSDFITLPCPTYPEILLSITTSRRLGDRLDQLACDHIHIATEGPLGFLSAAAARRRGLRYSSSYHTRFPEYLAARAPVPKALSYALLRRFHNRGSACLVATPRLESNLAARGFKNLRIWPRGVDTDLFRPMAESAVYADLPKPIWLTVGRVAVEKSLPAFLDLSLPGSKVVVGDGPLSPALRKRYPDVYFPGAKTGQDLAAFYAGADAFVFPSKTDTFGLVLLEAMASGLPVAAFPVMGPADVVENGETGILSENLQEAALAALKLSPTVCRNAAEKRSWRDCTETFMRIITEVEGGAID